MVKGQRRFAISDIHGCAGTLRYLLEGRLAVEKTDELFLLGDYIDRGPDSKGVLDLIMSYQSSGYAIRCLRGNHEAMLLKALTDMDSHALWEHVNGGDATLDAFQVSKANAIPEVYLAFIKALHYYFSLEDYLLVHAGFNFETDDPFKDYEAMLWIRGFEPDSQYLLGRTLVHGHTPRPFRAIQADVEARKTAINIDNGCAYPKPRMQGLVALNLDTFELHRQPYQED